MRSLSKERTFDLCLAWSNTKRGLFSALLHILTRFYFHLSSIIIHTPPNDHVTRLDSGDTPASSPDISDDIKQLIIERQRAREEKDWAASDRLRDEIAQHGIVVRDGKRGPIWENA